MPLRSSFSPISRRLQRRFHWSVIRKADSTTHYETLQVPVDASPKDIKKSFYSLSKTHHPDHNPNDPEASTRFVKISEAYNVLGTPEKRQRYDRDILRTQQHQGPGSGNVTPRGSYSSSGPAGGRPASGLSRRRTQFHGPPPSFYRSGGWGDQGAKRQAAHENTSSASAAGTEGGMGHGQKPFGPSNDVPHFDREGHFRTHTKHENRRRRRVSDDYIPEVPNTGMLANFVFVCSIISLGVFIPSFLFERMTRKAKGNN